MKLTKYPLVLPILVLSVGSLAHANEALDVLEGKKKAEDINLPAAPEGSAVSAPEPSYTPPAWSPSPMDSLWAKSVLFQDDANPYIQQLAITGFFDFQAAFGEVNVDRSGSTPKNSVDADGTRTRRARLGARIRAFGNTDIEANAEFAGDSDYSGIERLSARTELNENASLTYGKFRPTFTTEYSTEDEFLLTPDRSMLTNMIAPSQTLGIRYNQKWKDWEYGAGWFSGDRDPNIPGIQGNGFISLNARRTFIESSDETKLRGVWHVDYINNMDGNTSDSITRYNVKGRRSANGNQLVNENPSFRHLFSTGVTLEQDRYSFAADFMYAKGNSDVWGISLTPSYWAIPGTVKIVARYHYADSNDPGALVTTMGTSSDPAFDDSPFYVGDEFHSFYLGANLHLYQDRMLLMSGLEYDILKDETGGGFNADAWIWHTGARLSF
ncbi:hypothetical protein JIN85_17450 [Luteolibacter pohnpeiensis]|uniref:Alginate export domain-containing protein n=1 Tax=Luteolibacter pohnpeiensis TaxID=454153 RepID=A0A934VY58_9BACT|nr:porin [Luteolibacter pohnpeiensis]MBK1884209.1 hypothetical protein [Luteolibacter pohnpeiensis]